MLQENDFKSYIHQKKPKGKALSALCKKANKVKAMIRAQIEHIFAEQKERMDLFIRTIAIERATTKIGLANLFYN